MVEVDRDLHSCWQVGQMIGIAPSQFYLRESEKRIIVAISGRKITLDEPLRHFHFGAEVNRRVAGKLVDFAAEVVFLSRPIVVQSDPEQTTNGEHFMVAHSSESQLIQGVEFRRMGQAGQLGRYPVYVHFCGLNKDIRAKGCSVHESFQRGIAVHASRGVKVRDNVMYHVIGHGIMVAEDHFSSENDVQKNVIIHVRRAAQKVGLPSDKSATGIWIGNPRNRITHNRVGGSENSGIWYETTFAVTGAASALPGAKEVVPAKLNILKFAHNVVHSCNDHGVRFYPGRWLPEESNLAEMVVSYRNRGYGMLLHAHHGTRITSSVFYDNRLGGVDFDRSRNLTLENSVVIRTSGKEGAACPVEGGVELPSFNSPERMNGVSVENVGFDGFRNCVAKPIAIDTQDRKSVEGWVSTATKVKNCRFLDHSDPMDMRQLTRGRN